MPLRESFTCPFVFVRAGQAQHTRHGGKGGGLIVFHHRVLCTRENQDLVFHRTIMLRKSSFNPHVIPVTLTAFLTPNLHIWQCNSTIFTRSSLAALASTAGLLEISFPRRTWMMKMSSRTKPSGRTSRPSISLRLRRALWRRARRVASLMPRSQVGNARPEGAHDMICVPLVTFLYGRMEG